MQYTKDLKGKKVALLQKQHSEGVLRKRFSKKCNKFTGEHSCQNAISIKLHYNFIEIALYYGFYPVSLLIIFRTPFPKSISAWLLLLLEMYVSDALDNFAIWFIVSSRLRFRDSLYEGISKKSRQNKNWLPYLTFAIKIFSFPFKTQQLMEPIQFIKAYWRWYVEN